MHARALGPGVRARRQELRGRLQRAARQVRRRRVRVRRRLVGAQLRDRRLRRRRLRRRLRRPRLVHDGDVRLRSGVAWAAVRGRNLRAAALRRQLLGPRLVRVCRGGRRVAPGMPLPAGLGGADVRREGAAVAGVPEGVLRPRQLPMGRPREGGRADGGDGRSVLASARNARAAVRVPRGLRRRRLLHADAEGVPRRLQRPRLLRRRQRSVRVLLGVGRARLRPAASQGLLGPRALPPREVRVRAGAERRRLFGG